MHISNLNRIVFTIKKGARQPTLVSVPDQCPEHSLTFNVTGTLDIPSLFADEYYGLSACPVFGDSPPPPPNPCAVQIDSALASRISSSMSATACGWAVGPASIASSACTYPTATAKASSSVRWNGGIYRFCGVVFGLTGALFAPWLALFFALSMVK